MNTRARLGRLLAAPLLMGLSFAGTVPLVAGTAQASSSSVSQGGGSSGSAGSTSSASQSSSSGSTLSSPCGANNLESVTWSSNNGVVSGQALWSANTSCSDSNMSSITVQTQATDPDRDTFLGSNVGYCSDCGSTSGGGSEPCSANCVGFWDMKFTITWAFPVTDPLGAVNQDQLFPGDYTFFGGTGTVTCQLLSSNTTRCVIEQIIDVT
jgi:hypothetical protein